MHYCNYLFLCCFILFSCNHQEQKKSSIITTPIITDIDDTENLSFDTLALLSSTPKTAAMDSAAQKLLRQWAIQGLSIGIVKDGKLLYVKGFGYADAERKILVKPHHLFRIASASKLVTAVAIMRLVEEGKISLDSPVFGEKGILKVYNPWISDKTIYKLTIKHLLTHTGGWKNQLRTDPMFVPVIVAQTMRVASPISFENTLKFMLSQRGFIEPGTFYDYSNFGYCLLGRVIEELTKKPYEMYLRDEVLSAIGIGRMRIGKNRYKDRFAHEVKYYDAPDTPKNLSVYSPHDSVSRVYEGTHTEALAAAGGWIATPIDMLRLVCAIDGSDTKTDFLSASSIRLMTPVARDSVKNFEHLPLGWKQITLERWWRTGNLSSTSITISKMSNGYSWVMVTNTGSWRGPFFPYEMEGMMRRVLQNIQFPNHDLFEIAHILEMKALPRME